LLLLGHNLLTINARKPTKGSKEVDFRLVFISKKKEKITLLGWGQGPINVGRIKLKPTAFVKSPTKNSNPKLSNVFESKLEDFPHF